MDEHLRIRELNGRLRDLRRLRGRARHRRADIERGEAYGLVGESGAGKTVLALAILGLLRQPPARVAADEMRLEGESLLAQEPQGVAGPAGPADRHDLPRPHVGARPGLHGRSTAHRGHPPPRGSRAAGRPAAGAGAHAAGGAARPRDDAGQVPAPALGGPAPAGHHRLGSGLRCPAPDRRRAHAQPRCDRAGLDAEDHLAPARRVGREPALHRQQPGPRLGHVRPRGHPPEGPHRRDRPGARRGRQPATPLHRRPSPGSAPQGRAARRRTPARL